MGSTTGAGVALVLAEVFKAVPCDVLATGVAAGGATLFAVDEALGEDLVVGEEEPNTLDVALPVAFVVCAVRILPFAGEAELGDGELAELVMGAGAPVKSLFTVGGALPMGALDGMLAWPTAFALFGEGELEC
ncbi:MAG TPA: hypothetical protein VKX96_03155 [Chloroflexota bacterium]|nr:hypothetical protein [Chloroflexota bacterium]